MDAFGFFLIIFVGRPLVHDLMVEKDEVETGKSGLIHESLTYNPMTGEEKKKLIIYHRITRQELIRDQH